MKLINETEWDTIPLRQHLENITKKLGFNMDEWTVEVKKSKTGWRSSGFIRPISRYILLNVNENIESMDYIFIHELNHRQDNVNHRDMNEAYYRGLAKKFSEGVQLEKSVKIEKRDFIRERYERVLKHIEQKEQVIARYQKSLKKWRGKQRYYEKKLGLRNPA